MSSTRNARGRSRSHSPPDVIHRFRDATEDVREESPPPADDDDGCTQASALDCQAPTPLSVPEEIVKFREELPVSDVSVATGDPIDGGPLLSFACIPLAPDGVDARLSVDLEYEQAWFYREMVVGSPTSTYALAPGESLWLSIRNTQRKMLDQGAIDRVEAAEATESTIVDKDVLNVARNSSRSRNWNISGNGQFSLGKFTGGLSGGFSNTVTNSASSSAERIRETTRKSATSLKSLQKVEIREVSETVEEARRSRTLTNPYLDRSLLIYLYNLSKSFCVELSLSRLQPTLVIEISRIQFDRQFVLLNGPFLSDSLLDRDLRAALSDALETVSTLSEQFDAHTPEEMARLSLEYLFEEKDLFNLEVDPFPDVDPNDPGTSFDSQLGKFSGLRDATDNNVGIVFTTLAYYYRIYQDEVVPNNDSALALSLVLSLEEVLRPRWLGIEETENISNTLDARDYTEVLRRLGGFLAFAGLIRRQLEPGDAARSATEAASRAEFIIRRVVNHLNCHSSYYTERYVRYWADRTTMQAVRDFVEELIEGHVSMDAEELQELRESVLLNDIFLDNRSIVVPIGEGFPIELAGELIEAFELEGEERLQVPDTLSREVVVVPTDGLYLEPVAGECVLDDVTPRSAAEPIDVRIVEPEDS